MHPALRATMSQTAYRRPVTSRGSDGEPVFGTAVALACRYEATTRLVRTPSGDERVSSHRLSTTDTSCADTDGFWAPGDSSADETKVRFPLTLQVVPDAFGNASHVEVYL